MASKYNYTLEFSKPKGASDGESFSVCTNAPAASGGEQYQITELKFTKELYSPCSIDAILTVHGFSSDIADVSKKFASLSVKLSVAKDDLDPVVIAKDYFVHQVMPEVTFGTVSTCTVKLKIFSRDKLLTFDKFSRSYLNQKLSSDIMKGMLAGPLAACKVECNDNLNGLQCTFFVPQGKKDRLELIQPYHVQYNEDFYTFLARLAARNGEFLYFEDGKLTVGLSSNSVKLDYDEKTKTQTVLSMSVPATDKGSLSVNNFYSNYIYKEDEKYEKQKAAQEADATKKLDRTRVTYRNESMGMPVKVDKDQLYFNTDSFDEYFDVHDMSSKGLPDTFYDELTWGPYIKMVFKELLPVAASFYAGDKHIAGGLLAVLATNIALLEGLVANNRDRTNDKYRAWVKASNNGSTHASEQKNGDDVLSPFASFTGVDNASNLMSAFYHNVRQGEEKSSGNVVQMKLKAGIADVKVGDTVTFSKADYVVVKVSGSASIIPGKGLVDELLIDVIPKDNVTYPPYNPCYVHPVVGPQTAFVDNITDPRYMNRVRLRYPWQPEGDGASPWARVSTLMATRGGAGVNFRPKTGDEVIVDYIDGNIDRPYVVGSLFNSHTAPSKQGFYMSDRELKSDSGSKLILGRNNISAFLNDILPVYGTISPFLAPIMNANVREMIDNGSMMGSFFGKATLTDTYGFFTIQGDAAARKVTIDSLLGKVEISALTGISISAPFGDVTIEGKNVAIRASNNIVIESGLAIKGALEKAKKRKHSDRLFAKAESKWDKVGDIAADIGVQTLDRLLTSKMDLSLIRMAYEAIIPPKEGSLRLKSYRYLQLEAGPDGNAMDTAAGFRHTAAAVGLEDIKKLQGCVTWLSDSLFRKVERVKASAESNDKTYNEVSGHMIHPIKMPAAQIYRKSVSQNGKLKCTDDELVENDEIYLAILKLKRKDCLKTAKRLIDDVNALVKFINDPFQTTFRFKNFTPSKKCKKIIAEGFTVAVLNGNSMENTITTLLGLGNQDLERVRIFTDMKMTVRSAIAAMLRDEKSLNCSVVPQDCSDDDWARFINGIQEAPAAEGKGAAWDDSFKFVSTVKNQLFSESSVWDENMRGKILMSQDSSHTMSMNVNGGNLSWAAETGNVSTIENLQALLRKY